MSHHDDGSPGIVGVPSTDHNLGLDLMRVTEAAATATGRCAGRGDKESGDQAAVDAMVQVLAGVPVRGTICTVGSRHSFTSLARGGL